MTVVITDEAALRRIVAEAIAPVMAEIAAIRAAQAPPLSPLIDAVEFAKLLAVHPRTLHRMELAGEIPPAIRIGTKTVRWRREVIECWLESGGKLLSIRRSRGSL